MEGKKTLFESVDFDWNLGAEDSSNSSLLLVIYVYTILTNPNPSFLS